ncbi:nudix hydrolase 20, chloroplastic-like isoform X2 [Solanum tuberosum]|uniref:nudix hydrolase 20, chloroplastic-like isoform X2 n=1 Tax=Solanum tuberosum TaxID=4113 RepID=UPI00073A3AE4|nr:PREDICTED: nudix hydrolase 20, chloroplastic-like isoform X2 [Solanum tuberosum]
MSCNYLYRSVSHRLPNFICYTPIAPTILSHKSPFCSSRRRRQSRSFSISAGNSFTWDDVFRVPESPQNDDSALSGFFDKIKLCNRDLEKQCEFMPFVIEDQIIGYVHHGFADFLKPFQNVFIFPQDNTYGSHFGCYCTLHPNLSTPNDRTKAVANVVKSLGELIPGIRNELFPVASAFGEHIFFALERAAAPYFGIKPHDISCGENLIKECEEEAGIPRSISHTAKPVGAVSYVDIEGYRMKRDVLFCYDLKLPGGFIPHNEDGEVESFRLVPVTKVANIIRNTSFFKANCNLVITDFLFRHGHIKPEVFGYLKLLQSLRSGYCS